MSSVASIELPFESSMWLVFNGVDCSGASAFHFSLVTTHLLAFILGIWDESISSLKISKRQKFDHGYKLQSFEVDLLGFYGRLPSYYLGLPLGSNPKKVMFWNPVLETIQNFFPLFLERAFFLKGVD